jgi:SOS-response transcriptional repressor LexA
MRSVLVQRAHEAIDEEAVMSGIVAFIETYRAEHAYGPTYREIGAAVGLRSSSDVHRFVHRLVRQKHIAIDSGVSRSIRLAA